MRTRPADVTDADAVFLLLQGFATSYHPRRAAFDRNYEQLLSVMTYDSTDLLVAEDDGKVIGYALAARFLVLYANGPVTELQELMVDPAQRGRGVGRALVNAIIERARAAGAVEVTVPTRRARDYYVKLGFAETATFLKLPLS
ncbi:GNAT family N-acetyltransferase [Amycolatopsis acidicola]|uniref:GNAT family N-acetyltransferase n=1 Tax=Amycolatopsis acidicola TaxID=2596893 RepID=A0A5N0UTV2_9PSEU|nr:GNAT family N-acetyltransferase [Amycolatopsis acidicola]